MATVAEASNKKSQLGASLEDGLDVISEFKTYIFTLYRKVVLPKDGFVFWVKGSLLRGDALNEAPFNSLDTTTLPPNTITAKGSLHYATVLSQEQEQTFATNKVVFTSPAQINNLNAISPNFLYLAEHDGIRFAFSSRGEFYEQASLWHYHGDAVYADLATQIVDDPATFDVNNLIVSNSTPIWLAMNRVAREDWDLFPTPLAPIYASYLLPSNAVPPFISVHIDPGSTKSLVAGSYTDRTSSTSQLCTEHVMFTLVGLNNDSAQDFLDFIGQYTLDNPDVVGLMNSPAIRDDKRGQVELQALGQRKLIDLDINYYQTRSRSIARGLFQQVIVDYLITENAA